MATIPQGAGSPRPVPCVPRSLRGPQKGTATLRRRQRRFRTLVRQSNLHAQSLIINETGFILTPQQQMAIIKGSSFVPKRPTSLKTIRKDLDRLRRTLNLRIHHAIEHHRSNLRGIPITPQKKSHISSFVKTGWQPPEFITDSSPAWSSFSSSITSTCYRAVKAPNIPAAVRQGWEDLISSPDFFVVPADKGGKLVLWPRADYHAEAFRQLGDTSVYRRLSTADFEKSYSNCVDHRNSLLQSLYDQNNITRTELRAALKVKHAPPSFYLLPKAHKPDRPFVGRGILAVTSGVFKTLDEYITSVIAPLLPLIPGSLQDTPDLIRKMEQLQDLPSDAILFSADVVALYPSIPIEEGILAAVDFYTEHFDILATSCLNYGLLPPPSSSLFAKILGTILQNNFFTYRGKAFFQQISGIAMGSSISVFVANTFMFHRSRALVLSKNPKLLYLGRYIDDFVGVALAQPAEIVSLFSSITDEHINLTYVFTKPGEELAALDVLIKLSEGRPVFRLYRKPTDGHQYLHWTSAHPRHLLKSIPGCQTTRYLRNCSHPEAFTKAMTELLSRFRQRGYPANVLSKAFDKATSRSRAEALAPAPPRASPAAVFVTTFNDEHDNTIRAAAASLIFSLQQDQHISAISRAVNGPVIPERLTVAYRVDRSLGSSLRPILKFPCKDLGEKDDRSYNL